jgi:hypothetical protein
MRQDPVDQQTHTQLAVCNIRGIFNCVHKRIKKILDFIRSPLNRQKLVSLCFDCGKVFEQMPAQIGGHRQIHNQLAIFALGKGPGRKFSGSPIANQAGAREHVGEVALDLGSVTVQRKENSQIILRRH